MKKSKHFRKDVIMARIIAGVLLIVVIALIVFAVSLLNKPSGQDKDGQNTHNSQNIEDVKPGTEELKGDTSATENTEPEVNIDSESESEEELYVKMTTQVRLRKEPNTNCSTLDRIDGGTVLLVDEVLEGWYKVTYNGQVGYVSADYTVVVEKQ